jgi:hypothetical protein
MAIYYHKQSGYLPINCLMTSIYCINIFKYCTYSRDGDGGVFSVRANNCRPVESREPNAKTSAFDRGILSNTRPPVCLIYIIYT